MTVHLFVGTHLVSFLKNQGAIVLGISRKDRQSSEDVTNLNHAEIFTDVYAASFGK